MCWHFESGKGHDLSIRAKPGNITLTMDADRAVGLKLLVADGLGQIRGKHADIPFAKAHCRIVAVEHNIRESWD
jgi:hypothetical protein